MKISHKLLSQNGLNLLRIGTVTARNTKQWWKTLSAAGLELATLHSTLANNNPDSIFPAFSQPLDKVAALVRSPWVQNCMVRSPFIWSGVTLTKTWAYFDPDNTGRLLGLLQHDATRARFGHQNFTTTSEWARIWLSPFTFKQHRNLNPRCVPAVSHARTVLAWCCSTLVFK